jgi:hypothetical protein
VRETARALGVSVGVVSKTASRAEKAGVTWTVAEGMSDTALEERLYGRAVSPSDDRPRPDPVYLHTELRRPGVTLEVLHLEYLEQHPTGLRYTAFCDVYRRGLATASVTMRQVHKAGEKCFVDFSGRKASIVDPKTGQRVEVELFVAVLGASNFTYARATISQKVQDFVSAHVQAVTYFGGVPTMWVPGPAQERGGSGVPLRTRHPADLCGLCTPLRLGDGAGAAVLALVAPKPRTKPCPRRLATRRSAAASASTLTRTPRAGTTNVSARLMLTTTSVPSAERSLLGEPDIIIARRAPSVLEPIAM